MSDLPRLDEHAVDIDVAVDDVWPALLESLAHALSRPGAATYARLVGCADHAASGPRPLAEGSTIPGFRVSAIVPNRELVLEGRHRFSRYALTFRLERRAAHGSRVRAESRAIFPGAGGAVYRLLVLRTGAHVLGVRGLLAGIKRRSELVGDRDVER